MQSAFPELERKFFWGEIFSLFILFGTLSVSCQLEIQRKIVLSVYLWIFLGLAYSIWYSFCFWGEEAVPYYFVRHAVIFYYALFFLAAYKWGDLLLDWLGKYCILLSIAALFKMFMIGGVSIGYMVFLGLLWLSAVRRFNRTWIFWFGLLFIMFINLTTSSGTNKLMTIATLFAFLFVFIVRKLKKMSQVFSLYKLIFCVFLIAVPVIVVWQSVGFGNYVSQITAASGTVDNLPAFTGQDERLKLFEDFIDYNAVWRLVFWAYLLNQFFQNPFGIGLGTPFYDPQIAYFLHMPTMPGDEYVIPAHNFFLTLLVRLGIPFLIFSAFLITYFSRLIYSYLMLVKFKPLQDSKSSVVFSSFTVFFIAFVLASFNVVVESPLSAWFFWLSFGLCVRLTGDYIAEKNETMEKVMVP